MLAAATCGFSSDRTLTRFEFSQVHMGTRFRIVLYASDAASAERASKSAFDRIAALDAIMSDYRPSSELIELCGKAGGPAVKVSADLFRVLEKAQEVSKKSDGAFDITVGPLVRLWRRARRQHEMPDAESLAQARRLVGYENLRLDRVGRTAELLKPGMLLDLGGIAKGDAADEALLVLKRQGIESALVAAAGDIAVSSPPPGERGWRIGIAPLHSSDKPRYISLRDAGVSTSGDAEQHVVIGGVRYSHIIDPKTGLALAGRSSVTVIASNDITADSYATAASVLGPKRGLDLVDSTPGVAVLFVQEAEEGAQTYESRFPRPM
jgi:thiamine biosynthesis lipoprotein